MSERKELTSFALAEFKPLVDEYGFKDPSIANEGWMTRIDYLGSNLGIELELDWRDFAFFVLVVRLENGRLPGGYYVSNGKKCRKHLLSLLDERGLFRQKPKQFEQAKTKQAFESQVVQFRQFLMSHVRVLLAIDESDLFA
jgi:hypothetical protein